MIDYDRIKAELKAEIVEELSKKDYRAANDLSKPLGQVYTEYRKALYEKYGVCQWAKVWECIRGLSIRKAGCVYVRELHPEAEEIAAKFARKLCLEMLDDDDNARQGLEANHEQI